MSKIARWTVGMDDPIAVRKRVKFNPSTTTDTVRVGDLVCYDWDLAGDVEERTTNPASAHMGSDDNETTYAEGAQSYNARLLLVEKPATANLMFFAGVVAALGPEGGGHGDTLEIFVPNGAVVPVMCDQYCTVGRTIVAVRNGAYEGSYPSSAARPIGIAMETVDRSSTDGLVWVKVDPTLFMWNYHASKLMIDDEGTTSDHIVHRINVTTAQTGGRFTAFEIVSESSGAINTTGYAAALYVEHDVTAALGGGQQATASIWTNITGGTQTCCQYFGLEVGLYETGATITGVGCIAPRCLRTQLAQATSAGTHYMMYLRTEGDASDAPDGLFACYSAKAINMDAKTSAAVTHVIPIKMFITESGGPTAGTYYIMVSDTA